MKNVKVLGTGCANCKNTLKLIEDVAKEKGVEVQLEKNRGPETDHDLGCPVPRRAWWLTARWCTPAACSARAKVEGWL
ncbi:MAG: thioredoxin family protein [Rhodocyclaceae bacterium]|nr:thioredoxin family protein [Rhodocyclaceae bacterium]